jgi:hypothetical protein
MPSPFYRGGCHTGISQGRGCPMTLEGAWARRAPYVIFLVVVGLLEAILLAVTQWV